MIKIIICGGNRPNKMGFSAQSIVVGLIFLPRSYSNNTEKDAIKINNIYRSSKPTVPWRRTRTNSVILLSPIAVNPRRFVVLLYNLIFNRKTARKKIHFYRYKIYRGKNLGRPQLCIIMAGNRSAIVIDYYFMYIRRTYEYVILYAYGDTKTAELTHDYTCVNRFSIIYNGIVRKKKKKNYFFTTEHWSYKYSWFTFYARRAR